MARATDPWTPLGWAIVGGIATYVAIAVTRERARRLYPTIPPVPFPDLPPPPVAGYDHDDDLLYDPNDPPPSEDDYDDRLPCVTDLELAAALQAGDEAGCVLPNGLEPRKKTTVPDARLLVDLPIWPVRVGRQREVRVSYQDVRGKWHGRWGREFAAMRKRRDGTGGRFHAGIDLAGDTGDVVVAAEPGKVEAIFPFTAGTWAIYVRNEDGTMINYGEVEKGSWRDYGIATGAEVVAGQPLARVGAQNEGGAHMLHLEFYRPSVTVEKIRKGAMQWPLGDEAPADLLDPTLYLLGAQQRWIADHPEIV